MANIFLAAPSLARSVSPSLGHPISVDVQKVEREWNFLMKEAMTALTKQPARTTGARSRSPRFSSFHALRTHEQGGSPAVLEKGLSVYLDYLSTSNFAYLNESMLRLEICPYMSFDS